MTESNPKDRIAQSHSFNTIYLEKEVREDPWVRDFLGKFSLAEKIEVESLSQVIAKDFGMPYPVDNRGFHTLLLGKQRGPFIRQCPCSQESIRCGYYFLSVGLGCPIDCSYCFLQGFLNTSFPVLYVNFSDMEKELKEWEVRLSQENKTIRIGTGEMTDSLVFDPLTGYGKRLIQCFSSLPHLTLELKTKSIFIDSLLDSATTNVVLAWSLNPEKIAQIEEPNAPSPKDRVLAAEKAVKAGYKVGFHFDPIFAYPGWQELYYELLCLLFEKIPAQQIAWISLGTFRIFPSLRDTIRERHPQSQALLSEMVSGYDGKLRYFRKQRKEIYCFMKDSLEKLGNKTVPVYLCMESQELWDEVFGNTRPSFM